MKFPVIKGIMASINLSNEAVPRIQPARKVPVALESAVNQKVQYLLDKGIVEKCTTSSGWSSPIVIVTKNPVISESVTICDT